MTEAQRKGLTELATKVTISLLGLLLTILTSIGTWNLTRIVENTQDIAILKNIALTKNDRADIIAQVTRDTLEITKNMGILAETVKVIQTKQDRVMVDVTEVKGILNDNRETLMDIQKQQLNQTIKR